MISLEVTDKGAHGVELDGPRGNIDVKGLSDGSVQFGFRSPNFPQTFYLTLSRAEFLALRAALRVEAGRSRGGQ